MFIIKIVGLLLLVLGLATSAEASIVAALEQGRIDVNSAFPFPGVPAPVVPMTQIGSQQGGSFANTYGIDAFGRVRVRTMGALQMEKMVLVDGTSVGNLVGPGDLQNSLVVVFGISGYVESVDPVTGAFTALFDQGRLGIFEASMGFSHFNPDTWLPAQGNYSSPLIQWVLTDPLDIIPGDGEPLAGIAASQVNRAGANVSTSATAQQGVFLLEEEIDPGYSVATAGQDGFVDVITGHERFIGPVTEGIMLTNSQFTTTRFTPGGTPPETLTTSQQDVLQAISNWGVGVDFATSFHNPLDGLTGWNPIRVGNNMLPFDGTQGGDFFANQQSIQMHPVLFGSVIPEPGTFVIWGLGLIGVAAYARTQRKSRKAKQAD